jgi:ribosomal protein S18 acetylase RimI-like enzyme
VQSPPLKNGNLAVAACEDRDTDHKTIGGGAVDVRIRLARAGESGAIAGCARAAYSKYVGRIAKEPAPMLADYPSLVKAGVVWVLEEHGGLRGLLVMCKEEEHLLIENVAVDPKYQGRGFGRSLVAFAEEEALRQGLLEVRLYTNERMWENVALYNRLGFEEVGRRAEGGYRRVFMRKRLAPPARPT